MDSDSDSGSGSNVPPPNILLRNSVPSNAPVNPFLPISRSNSQSALSSSIMTHSNNLLNQSQKNPQTNDNIADQSWILDNIIKINTDLLCCPICFKIIFKHYQCPKCQRLLCSSCSQQIIKNSNQCPLCKITPWKPKQNIHLAYRQIIGSILFKCKLCEENNDAQKDKKHSLTELSKHLIKKHNIIPPGVSVFQRHYLQTAQNNIIKFNQYENLQIRYNLQKGSKKVCIFHSENGGVSYIKLNLQKMECNHPNLGLCKIKSQNVQDHVPKQYNIWIFQNQDNLDQFYTQDQQNQIEKAYQEYSKNKHLNEFMMDTQGKRYRVCFTKMLQINTSTDFQRKLKKLKIKI